MLFVRLGQIVAWYLMITSVLTLVMSFGFAVFGDQETFQQYFPGKSTGASIDAAGRYLFASIALGVLCHIGSVVTRMATPSE